MVNARMGKTTTAYSFVVDADPDFVFQAVFLISSLTRLSKVNPGDIHAHVVLGCDSTVEDLLKLLGVNVIRVAPFSASNPYCNKIVQLQTPLLRKYDTLVLCDCDVAFASPVAGHADLTLAGKIVDLPNPPLPILQNIFREAGLPHDQPTACTTFSWDGTQHVLSSSETCANADLTFANNCNGGLYMLKQELADALHAHWSRWAFWLLERQELLGAYSKHVDQVSFCLAAASLGLDTQSLAVEQNFPIHLHLTKASGLEGSPQAIHFHRRFDAHGWIDRTGVPVLDSVIDAVNDACRQTWIDLLRDGGAAGFLAVKKRARWVRWLNDVGRRGLALPDHLDSEPPLVAIETQGNCNLRCPYCPTSSSRPRDGALDVAAYQSIIADLSPHDGRFQLRFHFYNEPLLDKSLAQRIAFARKRLPGTFMKLVTNGVLMTVEVAETVFGAGIDQIAVSCHSEAVYNNMALLKAQAPQFDIELRTCYATTTWSDRRNALALSPRGYKRQFPSGVKPWGCSFLTAQIDYLGDVHLCCEDFRGDLVIGNIHTDALTSIMANSVSLIKRTFCGFYDLPCHHCAGYDLDPIRFYRLVEDLCRPGPGQEAGVLFDPERYVRANADLANASIDLYYHYINHGCGEGRALA